MKGRERELGGESRIVWASLQARAPESLEWPGKERTEEGRRLTMNRENLIGGKGRLGSRPPQIVLASMEGSWPRRVGVLEAPSSLFFVLH